MLNIKFQTIGGKQFWIDLICKNKFKVQQNIFTKHCRVIDNHNKRIACGKVDYCIEEFKKVTEDFPIANTGIILIHGIFRNAESFSFLENIFLEKGFDVYSFSYPSTRYSILKHADFLDDFIKRSIKNKKLHFVTHSMGGLVLRAYFKKYNLVLPGKAVMIAPPNKGSAWKDIIEQILPKTVKILMGKAGKEMEYNSDFIKLLPSPKCDFIVIAGGKSDYKGFNPLLNGDNDFTVTVEETKLKGMSGHYVIPYCHTSIIRKKETSNIILNYFNPDNY